MKSRPNGYLLIVFAFVITVIVLVGAVPGPDEQPSKSQRNNEIEHLIYSLNGPDLYRAHCAPCHGADGKGKGPVTPALKDLLPDLTTIAQRNGGVFPTEHVRSIIAGRNVTVAHGSREMPIWGEIFHQVQDDRDYGDIRLQNVTEYLRSIEEK
ncbi:MAG TPA: cytochrome c [Candidatus Angelobacter sp.]|nr:cytochrome c [Candidatus Angelobacter sp.]